MTTYRERRLGNWDAADIGDRAQTSLMARAEQRISSSCQHLEAAFKDVNREFDAPCPVKLVRRLTGLEIALGQLKQDCEKIALKRKTLLKSVIADQNANVDRLQEMMSMKNLESSSECQSQDSVDIDLNELSTEMNRQLNVL